MSDITNMLQLRGAQLASIDQRGDTFILHFSMVELIQEMEGAFQDSLWTQAVTLTIDEGMLSGELPACPCEINGGDLVNNIFTYRDHAPLPIDWQGDVVCKLTPTGGSANFAISGTRLQVEQIDNPRYLKHIDK